MNEPLSSKRYEPPNIDLNNNNISQTLAINLIGSHKKVLEIGTSTGYVSKILKERGNSVIGIEIDPEAAVIAQEYCDRMIIGDIENLDLDSSLGALSFDVILCGDLLEHLKNPSELLLNIKKFLAPDGYLVVSLPNCCHGDVLLNLLNGDFHYTSQGLLDETHLRFYGLKNIYGSFAKCGYQVSDIHTVILSVGTTELRLPPGTISPELLRFIQNLPDSSVYQYVFKANVSATITIPQIDEHNLSKTYSDSFEGSFIRLESHEKTVYALYNTIRKKSQILDQKEGEIELLTSNLTSIYMSTTWAVLEKFQMLSEIIFPIGTRRRTIFDLGISGARILVHEGWQALVFRIKSLFLRNVLHKKGVISPPILSTNVIGMSDTIPLSLEKPLSGYFIFPTDQLTEIKFLTATYIRKNSPLILSLRENSSESPVVRSVTVPSYGIQDNKFTSFKFAPIQQSEGKKYYFEVQSQGSPSAAVWFNPSTVSRVLQLLDSQGPIKGSVSFQVLSQKEVLDPYEIWRIKNEPDEMSKEALKDECIAFTYRPKISILTPVWNTDEKWIRLAIESVISQIYDNWELCLVDGGSTKSYIRSILEEYARKDPRIKIKLLTENKGIAGNSNEALSLATGDFIGFLDHDDEIASFALFEVVKLLNRNSAISYIYSDEDKMDAEGTRKDPFFKPDWSPDLFLSCNYLCHFSVVRADILRSVGGFRTGYDGSQDYDLFLRITERLKPEEIAHIPKILYHWRMIPQSASSSTDAKPYAYIAAKKAITDSLHRRKNEIEGVLDGYWTGSYRVKYIIQSNPVVTIIIPTRDNFKTLERCIDSILQKTAYRNFKILIIDNQSADEETIQYFKSLKCHPNITVLSYDEPFNFSVMNNYAVASVDSPYIVFLNNDTEIISGDWLSAMLEHAQRDSIGAVGGLLVYPNNTVQHAGIIIGDPFIAINSHKHMPYGQYGYFGRATEIQDVSAVTAACMMMKTELFREIGGFDPDLAVAYNDVDLCLRLRERQYLIVFTPYAQLYHYESMSRGYEDSPEKQARFNSEVEIIRHKWQSVIEKGDPYYNVNLTLEKEDFSIKL